MAFVAFTAGETDADSPLDQTFTDKMRLNFDALDGADVTNGDAHDHIGGDGAEINRTTLVLDYTAGDITQHTSEAEESSTSVSYAKMKEVRVPGNGTYRIGFSLRGSGDARVYQNGSAVGTIRTGNGTPGTHVVFEEDLGSWSAGDLIQIYGEADAASTVWVRDFYIRVAEIGIDFATTFTIESDIN